MSTTVWSSTAGTTVTQSLADQAATSATNAAASATAAATSAAEAATSAAAGLAKVSSNDTTAAVLSSKIVGDGSTLTVTETNDGSNETLTLATTGLQPLDATLTALAGVSVSADQVIYATGSDAFATTSLSAAGRALIDDSDVATMRGTLGLGSAATSASTAFLASASPTVSTGTLTLTSSGLTFSDGTTQTTASSGGGGSSSLTIANEGSDLSTATTKIDFVGAGVTASGSGANKTVTIPGGGSGITVQDEGSALSTLGTTLNFVGSGVTATGSGATKTITISAGSSGNFVPVTGGTFTGDVGIERNGATSLTLTRTNNASNFAAIEAAGGSGEQLTIKSNVSNQTGGFTAFDVGGSERMRIDASGNVLIGTASSTTDLSYSKKLKISGSGPSLFLEETDTSHSYSISALGSDLVFRDATNTTERVRINSSGNVGIGTSSPGELLTVYGSGYQAISLFSGSNNIRMYASGGDVGLQSVTSGNPIKFQTNDGSSIAERMRIDSTGNVDVGTQSAVNGGRYLDITNTNGVATDFSILRLITQQVGSSSTTSADLFKRKNGQLTLSNNETDSSAYLSFQVGASERVRIDSSGNVGIGTTASKPASKLNVVQGVTASNDGGVTPYFQFHNTNAGTDLKRWRVGALASGSLTFDSVNDAYSAAATHMLIDSTGDITLKRGVVNLESVSGNPAQMNFYCESGNAHYTRIQSSPHASYSGNVVLTLPTTSGTLATTGKAIAMAIVFG